MSSRGCILILLFVTLQLASLAVPPPARSGYVFFSRTFGDWTVLCWTDDGTGAPIGTRQCSLKAPPPKLEDAIPPQVGVSVITIAETQAGRFVVLLQVGGVLAPGSPIYLRIDSADPVAVKPNRYGEAVLTGDSAAGLVNAFIAGKALAIRSFRIAGNAPRDETVSLAGFGEALAAYRQNLRANGIVTGSSQ